MVMAGSSNVTLVTVSAPPAVSCRISAAVELPLATSFGTATTVEPPEGVAVRNRRISCLAVVAAAVPSKPENNTMRRMYRGLVEPARIAHTEEFAAVAAV
jgi:hypothetical protein